MKNVLFILNYTKPYEGSFIRSINALANELKAEGSRPVYLLPKESENTEWAKRIAMNGMPVYYFKPSVFSIFKNIRLIKKIVKKHKIGIVHSHFANYKIHIPASFAVWNNKKADYIVHVHTEPAKRNHVYDRLAAFFTNATAYIAVSESIKNALAITGRNTVELKNAVDFSRLDFVDRKFKKEDYMSAPNQKIVFMFADEFEKKGVDFVVRSLYEYDKERKFRLFLAVSDNKNEIRNQVKAICESTPPWVKFLPSRNDIATYFKAADVFVSANRLQGCPYTMIEAAYTGVPIIYCDAPGINELNIPWSIKINDSDYASLYEAINEIVNEDKAETEAMGMESRAYVMENYSLGGWVYEVMNIYKNIGRI
ncbi:MAG: glycosyltransferase family 4 protein [Clostridia bacterium]|nr:glycosyltransferase family 4 protein [Clostridia bacterium]